MLTINITKLNGLSLPDCAEGILERLIYKANNLDEAVDRIFDAVDEELIYYDDQWDLMKFYFTPCDADLNNAIDLLCEDLESAIYNGVLEEEEEN